MAAALGAGSSKERHGHKGKGRGGGEAEEPPVALADVVPISTDDYFNRNAEFSVWLRDARRIYFKWVFSFWFQKMTNATATRSSACGCATHAARLLEGCSCGE